MSTPIIMPRLGDFMTEGVITKIYKSSGDFVKQGEIIVEIETEKINYDLESIEEERVLSSLETAPLEELAEMMQQTTSDEGSSEDSNLT